MEVLGAAGSIVSILDVTCKTIDGLQELHGRWKETDAH